MNITNHCKERYCQRIKSIQSSQEIKQYIVLNSETVERDINNIYNNSKFIIQSQIGGDKNSKNFWLRDNIILVTDTSNSCIITLYKVDFGFPEHTNRTIVSDLYKEINKLNQELEVINGDIKEFIEEKRMHIENYNVEISILQNKIDILQQKSKVCEEEIKVKRLDDNLIRKQLEDYANKLCNSLEYKKDLEKLNK